MVGLGSIIHSMWVCSWLPVMALPYHYLLSFVAVAGNKKEVRAWSRSTLTTQPKKRTKHRTKQNAKVDTNVMHNYNQWPKTCFRNNNKIKVNKWTQIILKVCWCVFIFEKNEIGCVGLMRERNENMMGMGWKRKRKKNGCRKVSFFWTGHVVGLSPPLFAFGLKM